MNNILPEEAHKIIQNGKAVVIDVRTPSEFADGHIPGAKNFDIYDSTFEETIRGLKSDTIYVVNCQSGGRSAKACAKMQELGLVGAMNLEGGFIAWKKAGFPVEGY
ncbi:MAG: Rhodanese domain protein [Parcubacteria group bacterium GW2011_GWA1_44_13]|uniref:Rhodanese domain protein n=1 Tax=Candidatus Nomurabacteria bacterium GW2011_GWB1_44_12 TaxID=1618748 RepID=A0A837I7C2_9BACT|nr:MAG: Rhodanese domain protein [Candidatus Nomurabacteria bacterium GW2011_GWB1_44_12]KKT37746.1 MAG: Rhodanese domain protein [Parcubacteria group bacterium GW2011_GWA1_44_13]KKT59170.1 MAG: Rhodanese domain protein [Parcubacteria group bacterium GW2011_GWC1_44_26]HBB43973.1 rhodanese-like domain-containing protein [Candidatus Yonathbacteria bacterium]